MGLEQKLGSPFTPIHRPRPILTEQFCFEAATVALVGVNREKMTALLFHNCKPDKHRNIPRCNSATTAVPCSFCSYAAPVCLCPTGLPLTNWIRSSPLLFGEGERAFHCRPIVFLSFSTTLLAETRTKQPHSQLNKHRRFLLWGGDRKARNLCSVVPPNKMAQPKRGHQGARRTSFRHLAFFVCVCGKLDIFHFCKISGLIQNMGVSWDIR